MRIAWREGSRQRHADNGSHRGDPRDSDAVICADDCTCDHNTDESQPVGDDDTGDDS